MPVYDYFIPELEQNVTLVRPVERRDAPLEVLRTTVPERVAIAGAAQNPHTFDAQFARGWKRLEERGELPRDFTARQVKPLMERPAHA